MSITGVGFELEWGLKWGLGGWGRLDVGGTAESDGAGPGGVMGLGGGMLKAGRRTGRWGGIPVGPGPCPCPCEGLSPCPG